MSARKVFLLAVLIAFLVVLSFALAGSYILGQIFHISLSEFMFAGGLLLVVVGIHDMLAAGSHFEANLGDSPKHERSRKLQAIAISPIACPLLAGPGTIVTVMVYEGQSGLYFALSVCLVVFLLTMIILMFAGAISKLIGRIGMLAISRVMQIFIIAIGVHFMFDGLSQSFRGCSIEKK